MSKLIKFLSHVDMVKITCIDSTEIVEEARKLQGLNPTPTAALGRLLTMTSMMGSELKGEKDKITVQIMGDGPIGSMLATTNISGNVKGYVTNPIAEAPLNETGKLDVGTIVGKGNLRVIKDIGIKNAYIGMVPLQTGEIAEDFAYYFMKSEQRPTAIALGVLVEKDGSVKKAGGYMLEVLPDTPDQIIKLIENRIIESKSMTQMLENNMTLEEIAMYISDDLNTYLVEERNVKWECDCSKERFENAIKNMKQEDKEELAKGGNAEVICQFCRKKYNIEV